MAEQKFGHWGGVKLGHLALAGWHCQTKIVC